MFHSSTLLFFFFFISDRLRQKISVNYVGQNGIDSGGLSRQFCSNLVREMASHRIFGGGGSAKVLIADMEGNYSNMTVLK